MYIQSKTKEEDLNRGFTLIELLVVIAIIGVLASVVLASLGTARTKGTDAAVKDNLNGVRSQAELIATNGNNNYAGVCIDSNVMNALNVIKNTDTNPIASIATSSATPAAAGQITCHSLAGGYAIEAPISGGIAWCIDSNGFAGTTSVTTLIANDITCI